MGIVSLQKPWNMLDKYLFGLMMWMHCLIAGSPSLLNLLWFLGSKVLPEC